MLYVELDPARPPSLPRWRFLLSVDRGLLLSAEEVRVAIASAGLSDAATARMRCFALTQPRSLGVSFNPVTFYFCFVDEHLVALLAHVTNTPWGERHCYVLAPARGAGHGTRSFRFAKRFHVSPFLPMEGDYVLRLKVADGALRIAIRFTGGDPPFSACLSLRTRRLTRTEALRGALRRPAQGALTLARIHWQAARLFVKRAPFHEHPARRAAAGRRPRRPSTGRLP